MSKLSTWLIGGAVAYGLYYYSKLALGASDVQIVFKGVNIKGITNYGITLTIQNVSNATIVVTALTGEVSVNGNDLGNVSTFTTVTVPPASQQDITIDLNLSLLGLPAIITNIINNVSGNYDFKIVGNANVNNLVLPFSLDNPVTI